MKWCRQGHRLTFLEPLQVWTHPDPTSWCSAPQEGDEPVKPANPPTAPSPFGTLDVEATESQRAHERDLARLARPVEDREPVGPYAPTRNTDHPVVNMKLDAACPTCKHLVAAHVRDSDGAIMCSVCQMPDTDRAWLAERFDRIDQHLARVNASTIEPDWLTERFDTLAGALHDLMVAVVGDDGEPLVTKGFADAQYERGRAVGKDEQAKDCKVDHETAEEAAFNRGLDKGFERGRQQGDADRAQRGQTDHGPNGPWAQQAEALARTRAEGFKAGREIGKAEREAELLDQGWTPPGAVHELEVTSGPTDYEVWRDALTLANEHGAEGVTQRARWFHQELLNGVDGGANEEDPPDDNDVQAEPRMGTGND